MAQQHVSPIKYGLSNSRPGNFRQFTPQFLLQLGLAVSISSRAISFTGDIINGREQGEKNATQSKLAMFLVRPFQQLSLLSFYGVGTLVDVALILYVKIR